VGLGPFNFRRLQMRLVNLMQARVRNGEISERRLARLAGISQPHIHNVLKGAKLLSPDMADQILHRLRIDLMDLVMGEGSGPGSRQEEAPASSVCRTVAILDGWVGREHAFPKTISKERYPFPASAVERLDCPMAARLSPDALRPPIFSASGVVLLERSESVRLNPDEEGYFALDLGGGGTIGLVRRAKQRLYLWACYADVWQSIPLPRRAPLDLIQGRVVLVVRQF